MAGPVNGRTALLVALIAVALVLATVLVVGLVLPAPSASTTPSSGTSPPPTSYPCTPASGSSNIVGQLCVGDWPQYVLYDSANGNVYVSAEYTNNVSVVDAATFQKTATLNSPDARGLAIDPATGRLFVSDGFGDNVTVFSSSTGSYLATVSMTGYGYMVGEQYDAFTGDIYVLANNNADLLPLNPSSYAIGMPIALAANPGGGTGYAIQPTTHAIYFPARGEDAVALYGQLNGTNFANIPMPGLYGPTSTFLDPVNGLAYVMLGGMLDDPGNQMVLLSPSNNTIVSTLNLGLWPAAYAYDPVTELLFVSCAASGTISVVNAATNALVTTINLGPESEPGGIAIDPVTGHLFVGEDGTGELVELSAS